MYTFPMRFLISVIDTQTLSPHTPEEMKAIDDFNDKIEDAIVDSVVKGADKFKKNAPASQDVIITSAPPSGCAV